MCVWDWPTTTVNRLLSLDFHFSANFNTLQCIMLLTTCYFSPSTPSQHTLCDYVHMMGGSIRKEMTNSVTHVVAHAVNGSKYKKAVGLGTPIMSEQWVTKAWESRDTVWVIICESTYIICVYRCVGVWVWEVHDYYVYVLHRCLKITIQFTTDLILTSVRISTCIHTYVRRLCMRTDVCNWHID